MVEEAIHLTPQMFTMIPPDLCKELADALISLDSDHISAVILKVAPYDLALHKTLMKLVDCFDYPAILKALPTRETIL
ncbi:MAG: hypothetical protein WCK93_12330 [Nitrosomonadales bacterium]